MKKLSSDALARRIVALLRGVGAKAEAQAVRTGKSSAGEALRKVLPEHPLLRAAKESPGALAANRSEASLLRSAAHRKELSALSSLGGLVSEDRASYSSPLSRLAKELRNRKVHSHLHPLPTSSESLTMLPIDLPSNFGLGSKIGTNRPLNKGVLFRGGPVVERSSTGARVHMTRSPALAARYSGGTIYSPVEGAARNSANLHVYRTKGMARSGETPWSSSDQLLAMSGKQRREAVLEAYGKVGPEMGDKVYPTFYEDVVRIPRKFTPQVESAYQVSAPRRYRKAKNDYRPTSEYVRVARLKGKPFTDYLSDRDRRLLLEEG